MLKKIFVILILLLITTATFADELIIEPEAGRKPLLDAIQHANNAIDVVIYGFTDEILRDALLAAQQNKKTIRILIEPHPYRNETENDFTIRTINQNNLHYANPAFQLTHQKTIIIDQNTAYILTFNFTHSSFKKQRNFAIKITDPNTVQEIEQVFNADWQHQNTETHQATLVWSPVNSREKLMQLLRSATTSIDIYSENLTDYKTIGELAKAARRGIIVRILSSKLPREKALNYINNAGVQIQKSTDLEIHAKVIIIDHNKALLGSMNLTQPSIEKNRELSILTTDETVIQQLENTFNHDWGNHFTPLLHHAKKIPYFFNTFLSAKKHYSHYYPHHHRKKRSYLLN